MSVEEGVTANFSGTTGVHWNCPCPTRMDGHLTYHSFRISTYRDGSHVKMSMTPSDECFVPVPDLDKMVFDSVLGT